MLIHNYRKVEMTQMYMMEYYLAIKWNSDICYNMDEAWGHYVKWNETDKKGQILYNSVYVIYLQWENS